MEHEDVRLLDQLRTLHVVPAEHLDGIGGRRQIGDGQRLEPEVPRELLVAASCSVEPIDEGGCERTPAGSLLAAYEACGMDEVPPGHRVRECVVIDVLVVLVGTDDALDVAATVCVDADPRGPVARGVADQVVAGREHLAGCRSSSDTAPSPTRHRR